MGPTKPAHPTLASPLPLLITTPDPRQQGKIQHEHATLWLLVLFAIASHQTSILAIHQWIHNHASFLLDELGLRTRGGHARLPSQATLYRFIWRLDQHAELLEARARQWASRVVTQRDLRVIHASIDAKVLRGSRRERAGERAVSVLSAFLPELGLTVHQERLNGRESTQAKRLIKHLEALGAFVVTGDAAYLDRAFARAVVRAGGQSLIALRSNTPDVVESATWVFTLPACGTDTRHEISEVRSGEVWTWRVEARAAPPELTNAFPGAWQFVRCCREVFRKATGEIRTETDFALTSVTDPAQGLARVWRSHWGVENRCHHKRDTVFKEDACRSRKGAQALSTVRNVVLGMFHARGEQQVLAAVRRLNAQPQNLPAFFGWPS